MGRPKPLPQRRRRYLVKVDVPPAADLRVFVDDGVFTFRDHTARCHASIRQSQRYTVGHAGSRFARNHAGYDLTIEGDDPLALTHLLAARTSGPFACAVLPPNAAASGIVIHGQAFITTMERRPEPGNRTWWRAELWLVADG